ncbi:IMP dehydrogenase / GMP reductase domain-containing protein [Phthorimaea operculella]|nr:IMP dehydrogenase / GMP reductase domain-containing protein [Phthorimaea operculella]
MVDLYREIVFRNSGQTYRGVPVMASNMDTVGTFEMAQELAKHGLFTCIHKYYSIDQWKKFANILKPSNIWRPAPVQLKPTSSGYPRSEQHYRTALRVSRRGQRVLATFRRVRQESSSCFPHTIINYVTRMRFVCLDVANRYSQHFVEYVRRVRAAFPTHTIIVSVNIAWSKLSPEQCYKNEAGNVVTGEMVEELILSGADIIKVGIGPGSVCTTRIKTGVGYPQLSAVIECADAAHGLKGHIISLQFGSSLHQVSKRTAAACPGDVAKAFGAGADFVMAGGMFAGHDQCGEVMTKPDGKQVKLFYGMSSSTAMLKHSGGVADYRSSEGKELPDL